MFFNLPVRPSAGVTPEVQWSCWKPQQEVCILDPSCSSLQDSRLISLTENSRELWRAAFVIKKICLAIVSLPYSAFNIEYIYICLWCFPSTRFQLLKEFLLADEMPLSCNAKIAFLSKLLWTPRCPRRGLTLEASVQSHLALDVWFCSLQLQHEVSNSLNYIL